MRSLLAALRGQTKVILPLDGVEMPVRVKKIRPNLEKRIETRTIRGPIQCIILYSLTRTPDAVRTYSERIVDADMYIT